MMNNLLENIYFDPRHPASFGGAQKLYKFAKSIDDTITLKHVKDWLSSRHEYSLYKESKSKFKRNRIYVSYINEQWEIDLLDYSSLSRFNNGVKYLITIIDVFSKYLYVIPIKNKSMKEVTSKFDSLFKTVHPTKIRSDRGKEFDNQQFRNLCSKYNIKYFVTQNQFKKCAVVERINRTLRMKIQRFMTHKLTKKYVDVIDQIVHSYNNTKHKSIGMRPKDVNFHNESEVFKNLYGAKNILDLMKKSKQLDHKYEIGDTVRSKYDPIVFDKGNTQKWSDIVYKVRKVYNKMTKPQYSLELDGKQLQRRFYPEELQKVKIDDNTIWLIEKRLAYRTRDNKREVLVKFKGYPSSYNQWIPVTAAKDQ